MRFATVLLKKTIPSSFSYYACLIYINLCNLWDDVRKCESNAVFCLQLMIFIIFFFIFIILCDRTDQKPFEFYTIFHIIMKFREDNEKHEWNKCDMTLLKLKRCFFSDWNSSRFGWKTGWKHFINERTNDWWRGTICMQAINEIRIQIKSISCLF